MLDIDSARTELDALFSELDSAISTLVLARNLPFVGDDIAGATDTILAGLREARDRINATLDQAESLTTEDAMIALAEAINDLDILGQADLITATANGTELDIRLTYDTEITLPPADFDLGTSTGLPIGSFEMDGTIQLAAEAAFDIAFTLDGAAATFTLDADAVDPEFSLSLDGEIDYASTARFGFIETSIEDNEEATPGDPLDDIELALTLNLRDGQDAEVKLNGHATIDASVTAQSETLSILPGVNADFFLDLSYVDADLLGDEPADFDLDIQLRNVELQIQGLVDLYQEIFGTIDNIFDTFPVGQIIDILTAELPVISDILPDSFDIFPEGDGGGDGKITLADLVVFLAQIPGASESVPALDFIIAVFKVVNALDALETLSEALADGTFDIGDLTLASSALDTIENGDALQEDDDLVDSAGTDLTALIDFINAVKGINSTSDGDTSGAPATLSAAPGDEVAPDDSIIKFPWLSTPQDLLDSVGGILLNGFGANPITLVELDIPELSFEVSQRIPITFGIFYGFVEGGLSAKIDINAGYDTSGFTADGFEFGRGFFISPDLPSIDTVDDEGNPVTKQPFGELGLTLRAGGGVDVVLARVEVGGGLLGEINLFLGGTGPGEETPSRAYFQELAGCLINEIGGRIAVGLDVTFSIGFGIFSISKTIGLAEVTLAQFNIDPCESHGDAAIPEVDMAGLAFAATDGILTLNVGSRANLRTIEDAVDQNYDEDGQPAGGPAENEVFTVSRVPLPEVEEGETPPEAIDPLDELAVNAFGVFERFDSDADFTLIRADGGSGNDRLTVEDGIDIDASFSGGAGNDVLTGSDGDDSLFGGNDRDQLFGGAGDDSLYGGNGNDILRGGAGADLIDGGGGTADQIDYSDSAEGVTLQVNPANAAETLGYGGDAEGDVVLGVEYFIGSRFNDVFYGNVSESNVIDSGEGNDLLVGGDREDLFIGGAGADVMYGNQPGRTDNDSDAASYVFSRGAVNIDVQTNVAAGGDAQGDRFFGVEDFQLTSFSDRINGNEENNLIDAYDGDDFIDGRGGRDSVLAGLGDDTVIGGLDRDTLDGGGFLNFRAGRDLLSYQTATTGVDANLRSGEARAIGGTGRDTIVIGGLLAYDAETGEPVYLAASDDYVVSTFENLRGSGFADVLTGDDTNNTIQGLAGADTLEGGAGRDTLIGGTGADSLSGGQGTDTADYRSSLQAVIADLNTSGSAGDASGDTYTGVENLTGSRLADILIGDGQDNELNPFQNLNSRLEELFGNGGTDTAILNFADGFDDEGKFITLDAAGNGGVTESPGGVLRTLVQMNSIEELKAFTGEGDDLINIQYEGGNDVINTHGGNDIVLANSGFDIVFSGAGDDTVFRLVPTTLSTFAVDDIGAFEAIDQGFYLDGGSGFDTLGIDLSYETADLTLFNTAPDGTDSDFTYSSVNGGTFTNFEAYSFLFAGSGDDVLGQLGEISTFFAGNDGTDLVTTGFGFDTADGGESGETFVLNGDPITVEDIDILVVDYSSAERGNMFTGPTPQSNIDASDVGQASLTVTLGDEIIETIASVDYRNFERLFFTGTDRADILRGMDQAPRQIEGDVLRGGEGNDRLFGGRGNDVLIGANRGGAREEQDTLVGGGGADRFVLADFGGLLINGLEDYATISDFSRSDEDVIVLAGRASDYEILFQSIGSASVTSVIGTVGTASAPGRAIATVVSQFGGIDLNSSDFEYLGLPPIGGGGVVIPPISFATADAGTTAIQRALTALETDVTDSPDLAISMYRAGLLDDMGLIETVTKATDTIATGRSLDTTIDLDTQEIVRSDAAITADALAPGERGIEAEDITDDAQSLIDAVIADFAIARPLGLDTSLYSTTTYDGNGAAGGIFQNLFGLDSGIVISTGRVEDILGENTEDGQFNLDPESSPKYALDFVSLGTLAPGLNFYRAELPTLPGGIASLRLTDDADYAGGASGRFSAFDLDAIKISTASINGGSGFDVAAFDALEGLDVFDFSAAGTVLTGGAQRPGNFQADDLYGTINGFLNQGEARLDISGSDTGTAADSEGSFSLGEGGSVGFNLTSNVSNPGDVPTYVYLVEAGGVENLDGVVRASSRPIGTAGDLSTDLGAPGLEGDTTRITSTFEVDFTGASGTQPEFVENTMIDFFDIVMVTEELPERGGIIDPDVFQIKINGFDGISDGSGVTVTMNNLAPTPFGAYEPGLMLNLVADGPLASEIKADAYTVVYRVAGPIINGTNTIEIEVSDRKDAFLDTALFISAVQPGGPGNAAPTARNDFLDVAEGDTGTVDLITGIGLDTDPEGDALTITELRLLDADGMIRQTITPGLLDDTDLADDQGTVRVSTDGTVTFNTGSDFDGLNTGDLQTVRFGYVLSDGTNTETGELTVRVAGEGAANTAPTITSGTAFDLIENTTGPVVLSATDAQGDPLAWAITGGDDAALFDIDAATGAVSFLSAPDFETPADTGADNIYDLNVSVSDGALSSAAAVQITVTDEDETVPLIDVLGTDGRDVLIGTDADERIIGLGGSYDRLTGGAGSDQFVFGAELSNGTAERDRITDFETGLDSIVLGSADYSVDLFDSFALITAGPDSDRIYVYGDAATEADLGIRIGTVDDFLFN